MQKHAAENNAKNFYFWFKDVYVQASIVLSPIRSLDDTLYNERMKINDGVNFLASSLIGLLR